MRDNMSYQTKSFTSFDLFAGAGGLSLGFSMAGISPVYALEQDKWAGETYSLNNLKVKLEIENIENISNSEIKKLEPLSPDVIIGGPPCQGFSHANSGNKDLKDPRNSLFLEFVRFVKIIQPKICVIENVPGLLKTRLNNGLMAIDAIHGALFDIGYSAKWKVLNSVDYGVPQKRERLFIIATRNDLNYIDFEWPIQTHKSIEKKLQINLFDMRNEDKNTYISLWDAISDLPQIYAVDWCKNLTYPKSTQNKYQTEMRELAFDIIHNHEPMRHTARITERFETIGFGQSEADVPQHLRPRRRGGNGELSGIVYDQNSRRQHPDVPCNAMVASSHTNFIHPYLNRNFTVREMMRIQSFPDNFIVCGKRAVLSKKLSLRKGYIDDIYLDQRAQIGNAVPPLLAKAVGRAVNKWLNLNRKEQINVAKST